MAAFELERWLATLQLSNLVQTFKENELLTHDVIRALTDQDLKDIGITLLGHRKKILLEAQRLGVATPALFSASPEKETPAAPSMRADAPATEDPSVQPVKDIRKAKWWPGAGGGWIGPVAQMNVLQMNHLKYYHDELLTLGYNGVELWKPGKVLGACGKLFKSDSDWNIKAFDIWDDILLFAGGASTRADWQVWNMVGHKMMHHGNVTGVSFLGACLLGPANPNQFFGVADCIPSAQAVDFVEGITTRRITMHMPGKIVTRDVDADNHVIVSGWDRAWSYDLRSDSNSPVMSFVAGGAIIKSGLIKKPTTPANQVWIGYEDGVKIFDTRKGLPLGEKKVRSYAIAGHHSILAISNRDGFYFFDTTIPGWESGVPLHEIPVTNLYAEGMEMSGESLSVQHGGQIRVVTWN